MSKIFDVSMNEPHISAMRTLCIQYIVYVNETIICMTVQALAFCSRLTCETETEQKQNGTKQELNRTKTVLYTLLNFAFFAGPCSNHEIKT